MIKFFRRIRQNLLTENKFNKYLLYAVGEIVLVVIGILIALQINNINEQSKINASVAKHLIILEQNMVEDQIQLRELQQIMIGNCHYADSSMMQIRTLIPVDNQIKKYLGKLILENQFRPNNNAIETITQSNEIRSLDSELQTAILNYYALIERTKEREHISNTQIQSKYENHINTYYPEIFQKDNKWEFVKTFYKNDPRPVTPINENKFLLDRPLEALLVSRYFQSTVLQGYYTDLLESSETILKLLSEESKH